MKGLLAVGLTALLSGPVLGQGVGGKGSGSVELGAGGEADGDMWAQSGGSSADKYPIDEVSRPIIMPKGMAELGGAFAIGLDKSGAGDNLGLDVHGRYGVMDKVEAGLDLKVALAAPGALGAGDLMAITLNGTYGVFAIMAASLDLNILRTPNFTSTGGVSTETKVAIGLGAPIKVKVGETVAIRALHPIALRPGGGFLVPGPVGGAIPVAAPKVALIYFGQEPYQTGFALPFGAVFNVTPALALTLDFAVILPDFESDAKQVPMILAGQWSVSEMLDVGMRFGFDNLTPFDPPGPTGPGAADFRHISLFGNLRF